MADMFHFEKISYVASGIRIEVDLTRFGKQFREAQWWLGNQVLQDCKPFMPFLTGSMQQRSSVMKEGREVEFPGPYARFQYGGLVMVDPVTRSPWAREGVEKVVTDRKLTYSSPGAVDHWFDAAKAAHGEVWISETKRIGGGG